MKREKKIGIFIFCILVMIAPSTVLLSIFLTRINAEPNQFPAQIPRPFFPNHFSIVESAVGDASRLEKLLSLHHGVVVLLYR
jgi:hypothetical protein